MENKNEFIINMYLYIAEKCGYGDAMHKLNDDQRVFYIMQNLEMEVNNCGFSQFSCNTDDKEKEEKNARLLNECDMEFYEYEEDLEELNY